MTVHRPPDIVVLLSDEHAATAAGFAGHPHIRTPHLDRFGAEGWIFDAAYCSSPMCVPSRLSMLTGRQVHDIGAWDNAVHPEPDWRTWGHRLRPAGYRSTLVGRTHINGADRLIGFDERLSDDLPHWLEQSDRPPPRTPEWQRSSNSHVSESGPGQHTHTTHDRNAADLAVDFLRQRASETDRPPFLLYVGFMHPHFPLIAPPRLRALYDTADVTLPATWNEPIEDQHPVIAHLRRSFRNDEELDEDLAREATASYWALTTHLDEQVGKILDAIDAPGLRDSTTVVYTSDHGEMAGHHGIWQKQCFYEPAVRVPLLMRTPDHRSGSVPAERVPSTVSLIDLLPTLLDVAGLPVDPDLPGSSLAWTAQDPPHEPRAVLSEYHAQGMLTGGFMIRHGHYSYCAYVGHPPQLFDVVADPDQVDDLAGNPAYTDLEAEMAARLADLVDIEAADHRARADQTQRSAD